jgi:hypothetical protein
LLQQPGAESTDYAEQVDDILALLRGTYRSAEGLEAHAVPGGGTRPQVWILGSSGGQSASVAGRNSLRFVAGHRRHGSDPGALNAAIAPPPVPSLAATTPAMRPPNRVIWPDTQSWALAGCQSGVSYSASSAKPLVSTAEWMPFLISPAATSVGDPLTSRIRPARRFPSGA